MKEIVLYGADLAGEKFYYRYKNRFRIKYALDKNCHRVFHGIQVYSFEEKKNEIEQELIIVATETVETYNEIAVFLESNGLQEFRNFQSVDSIDKDLAILYGNCHFSGLGQYLRNNPVFNKKYDLRYYFIRADIPYPKKVELEHCKLVIAQDIRNGNSFRVPGAEELFDSVGENCTKILVPNLYGCNLFFPQAEKERVDNNGILKHIGNEAICDKGTEGQKWSVTWISGWRDLNIEYMYEQGKSIDDIVDMIQNGDVYSSEMILENFENEIRKLQEREKECDIKISDYILDNYQKQQTFYDHNHPAKDVIMEKGRRILKLLGIEIDEAVTTMDRKSVVDGGELFLYGCVRRALGIQYEQLYIKKNQYNASLYNRPIDIKEYVESYILWHYAEQ